jgi:hypothetical protein
MQEREMERDGNGSGRVTITKRRGAGHGNLRADPMKKLKKNANEKCTCALFFRVYSSTFDS